MVGVVSFSMALQPSHSHLPPRCYFIITLSWIKQKDGFKLEADKVIRLNIAGQHHGASTHPPLSHQLYVRGILQSRLPHLPTPYVYPLAVPL
jgi:hypothetical protein